MEGLWGVKWGCWVCFLFIGWKNKSRVWLLGWLCIQNPMFYCKGAESSRYALSGCKEERKEHEKMCLHLIPLYTSTQLTQAVSLLFIPGMFLVTQFFILHFKHFHMGEHVLAAWNELPGRPILFQRWPYR